MTQEKKAKAYDEALDRAKKELQTCGSTDCDAARQIFRFFPELRESEDEKVKERAIAILKQQRDYWSYDGPANKFPPSTKRKDLVEAIDVALAYLEKQKEQKPEHFELKAGKWYICHRAFCCRADHLTVKEGERFMCEKDGIVKGFVIKEPEKYFKECSAPAPMEDEQKEQKPRWEINNPHTTKWTKEMIDEKFEELVEEYHKQKPVVTHGETYHVDTLGTQQVIAGKMPQKPAEWSEEDEEMLKWIEDILLIADDDLNDKLNGKVSQITDSAYSSIKICIAKCFSWLKSLRPSWKPTKAMLDALNWARSEFHPDCIDTMDNLTYLYKELEQLYYDGN